MEDLSNERLEELGGTVELILSLLKSIEEEELEAVARAFQKDSAFGVFIDPSAYQDGRRFRLNAQVSKVCEHLLTLKQELASIPKIVF